MSLQTAAARAEKALRKRDAAQLELDAAQRELNAALAKLNAASAALSEPRKALKSAKNPKPESPAAKEKPVPKAEKTSYKKQQYAKDTGRLLKDLSEDDIKNAKLDLVRLHKRGFNDVQIGQALNIKRPLIVQFRKSLNLPGKAKGRPSKSANKTRGDGKMLPGQSVSDFGIPKRSERKKRKTVEVKAEASTSSNSAPESPAPELLAPDTWDLTSHLGDEVDLSGGRKGRPITSPISEEQLSRLKQSHEIEEVGAGTGHQKWILITKR